MRERDEQLKLKQVAMRRDLAKMSAEEAKEAVERQKEDNRAIADIMREEADAIRQQRLLEEQVHSLTVQDQALQIMEERKRRPKEAKEKLLSEKEEQSKKLREELENAQRLKQEEDRRMEEERQDMIRQLRAINRVKKKHVTVFDPTETSGVGLLEEMSFMEMKERLAVERSRLEEAKLIKRGEILDVKEKKAKDLEARTQSILRARQVKASSHKAATERRRAQEEAQQLNETAQREAAALELDQKLTTKKEERQREMDALQAEADRIRRQQQYMGIAKGQVEESRAEELLKGRERESKEFQSKIKAEAEKEEESKDTDKRNRRVKAKKEVQAKVAAVALRDKEVLQERLEAVEKLKKDVLAKKKMFLEGREEYQTMKTVVKEHNLYAARMSEESLRKVSA
eukprot:gene4614-5859_t